MTLYPLAKTKEAREHISKPPPEEHKLFHQWLDIRGGWYCKPCRYDKYGSYYNWDIQANMAALSALITQSILPHTANNAYGRFAGNNHAILFPDTQYETTIYVTDNTFILINSDLALTSYRLKRGDVAAIDDYISNAMNTLGDRYSLVHTIISWAKDNGNADIYDALINYENE